MNFIRPDFKVNYFPGGVYRMWINEHWCYIGGTTNLRDRFSRWKNDILKRPRKLNSNLRILLPIAHTIRFEIVEIVEDLSLVKDREFFYLKDVFNKDFCLNVTPDTKTGSGKKLTISDRCKEVPVGYKEYNGLVFPIAIGFSPKL